MQTLKQKLTSRKFWVALVGFITPLLLAFGVTEEAATQIASILMAGATLITYILAESSVDTAREETILIEEVEEEE